MEHDPGCQSFVTCILFFTWGQGRKVIFQHTGSFGWVLDIAWILVPMYSNVTCNSRTLGPQINDCHGLMNKDISVASSKIKLKG